MKTITIPVEDSEHKALLKKKGNHTWKYALIQGCEYLEGENANRH